MVQLGVWSCGVGIPLNVALNFKIPLKLSLVSRSLNLVGLNFDTK